MWKAELSTNLLQLYVCTLLFARTNQLFSTSVNRQSPQLPLIPKDENCRNRSFQPRTLPVAHSSPTSPVVWLTGPLLWRPLGALYRLHGQSSPLHCSVAAPARVCRLQHCTARPAGRRTLAPPPIAARHRRQPANGRVRSPPPLLTN